MADIQTDVANLTTLIDKLKLIVEGGDTAEITTGSGPRPSVSKAVKDAIAAVAVEQQQAIAAINARLDAAGAP